MTAGAGIEVTAGFSSLAFGLAIVQPKLQLDDEPPRQWRWGTHILPVAPGHHRVRCWFRWGLFTHGGDATVEVDVPPGALVRVGYKSPSWFVFNKGRWTQGPTVAFPTSGAGWHPDPSGRHALRYWDGSGWTPHVSTGGVASTDVLA